MTTKFSDKEFARLGHSDVVYVRAVAASDLPDHIEVGDGVEQVFAIHDAGGTPLALAQDRATAFGIARRNDRTPVSVH